MSLEQFDRTLVTNDLVQDLKWDPALRATFEEDARQILDRYPLQSKEREAIENRDFRTLYDMGVHPYLLAQLSRLLHGTGDEGGGSSTPAQALINSLLGQDDPSHPV